MIKLSDIIVISGGNSRNSALLIIEIKNRKKLKILIIQ